MPKDSKYSERFPSLRSLSFEELLEVTHRERDHKRNLVVLTVIIFALCLTVTGYLGIANWSQKNSVEEARAATFEYETHTDTIFNKDAMTEINAYRESLDLKTVGAIRENTHLVALLEGCAYNLGRNWDQKRCEEFSSTNDIGFSIEVYTLPSNPDPEIGQSNAPDVSGLMAQLETRFEQFENNGSEFSIPPVLDPDTKNAKVMVIGDGSDEWRVIIFTTNKKVR